MVQPKSFLKTLALIHFSMVMGLVLFGLVVYFQSEGWVVATDGDNDIFLYLVPLIALLGYFGSQIIFKKILLKILPEDDTPTKLAKYRVASLIKFACIEAPALFALVAFYLTNNPLFLVIALCMTAYLLVQRPNRSRLFDDVLLDFDEKKQFDNLNH